MTRVFLALLQMALALSLAEAARPTLSQIREWPATVPVTQASTAFGFSRSHGFELVKRGQFPAKVIKAGARYCVVTDSILKQLTAGERDGDAA